MDTSTGPDTPVTNLFDRIRLKRTLTSPGGVLLWPGIIFVTLFALLVLSTVVATWPTYSRLKDCWEMLSFVGATLAGVGTLFIALTLGASFLALRAQSEQLILQQQELSESRAQLKEAADIQAKTLANLERQAQSALLTAEIHGLASRLEGYEAQIKMVVTTTGYNTTNLAERNDGVPTYQVEDEEGRTHLLIQLPVEEDEDRWCLWRPDHAGFDSRSIFEGALVEE